MLTVSDKLQLLKNIQYRKSFKGEDKITNEVALYLKSKTLEGAKFIWFHVPNETFINDKRAMLDAMKKQCLGVIAGAPDFVIFLKNKVLLIEIKTEKGRQSYNQLLIQKWCEHCGISYRICKSVEQLELILKKEAFI